MGKTGHNILPSPQPCASICYNQYSSPFSRILPLLFQLKFNDFHKFMDNLQTEVLQMEYHEFSKGAKTITELDFARILLRYTFLNAEEYETILDRLVNRLTDEQGITFEEFKDFCLFLNNLDDFQVCKRRLTTHKCAVLGDIL